jgi:hypothetical protein
MFGVIGNFVHVLMCQWQPGAAVTLGVGNRTLLVLKKVIPNFVDVLVVTRVGVIEIVLPIRDGTVQIGHVAHSSIEIAYSGQLAKANRALSSSPAGTTPSFNSCAFP